MNDERHQVCGQSGQGSEGNGESISPFKSSQTASAGVRPFGDLPNIEQPGNSGAIQHNGSIIRVGEMFAVLGVVFLSG